MDTPTTRKKAARERKREPIRRQAILRAAERLFSHNGFSSVSMADIGAEVGIAASAIYWHFPNKHALLASIFDDCLERIASAQEAVITKNRAAEDRLMELIEQHVEFVLTERDVARVYYQEAVHLSEEEQQRLRRRQSAMIAVWTDLLCDFRSELDRADARTLINAAIGAVQSALRTRTGSDTETHRRLLANAAWRVVTL